MSTSRLKAISKIDCKLKRGGQDLFLERLYQHLMPTLIGNGATPSVLVGRGFGEHGLSVSEIGVVLLDGTMVPEGVDSEKVDVRKARSLAQMGAFHGVAIHEFGHQRHSVWTARFDQKSVTPAVLSTMMLLEESRMECAVVCRRPQDRRWLQMAVKQLLLAHGVSDAHDPYQLAGLILARVDAGVLHPCDVTGLETWVADRIGPDKLAELRDLWVRAQGCPDDDATELAEIASLWLAATGQADDNGEGSGDGDGSASGDPSGEPGEGKGSCGGTDDDADESDSSDDADESDSSDETDDADESDSSDKADDTDETDSSDSSDSSHSARGSGGAGDDSPATSSTESEGDDLLNDMLDRSEARARESVRQEAEAEDALDAEREAEHTARTQEAIRVADERNEAKTVFSTKRTYADGDRPPNAAERSACRALTRDLLKLAVSDVSRTKVWSDEPQGRMVPRRAMQRAAQIAAGKPATAQIFRGTHRAHNPHPKPVVGLAIDVSGSMSAMAAPMGTLAWLLPQAFRPLGGQFAAVTFGDRAWPLATPGRYPDAVPEWHPSDGSEKVGAALIALSGALPMFDRTKVRVMVICSDNYWVDTRQRSLGIAQIDRLNRAGVLCVSINANRQETISGLVNIEVPNPAGDPMAAVRVIGTTLHQLLASKS